MKVNEILEKVEELRDSFTSEDVNAIVDGIYTALVYSSESMDELHDELETVTDDLQTMYKDIFQLTKSMFKILNLVKDEVVE